MKKLFLSVAILIFISNISFAQINSAQSGDWSSGSTWSGGNVPTKNDNVNISSGHIVNIDIAECNSVTFSDTSAHLTMKDSLSLFNVYGNFTLGALTHRVFSLWPAGAKIKFTGIAPVQKLSGWSNTGSSTSFMEMVVEKDSGKVTTDSTNMRFSFGTNLEIIKGTFELQATDDIETRTIGGTGTTATVTIQSGGLFTMLGSGSHIRKGTFTDTITKRTGKWTVYGKAAFASTSTNLINLGGLDIENGGQVNLNTGWSTSTTVFNPYNVTVKSGGILYNGTTTSLWHPSAYLIIEPGGELNCASSTIVLPVNFINNTGIIRFSRSGDQTIPLSLTTFWNLFLSGSGIKTLGANITVNFTFSIRGTAALNLGGFTLTYKPGAVLQYGASGQTSAQITTDSEWPANNGPNNVTIYNSGGVILHDNRTINNTLVLSQGDFDNNGASDDKTLTLANNALIRRNSGQLTAPPSFGSSINIEYASSITQVTTGFEIPSSEATLNNLNISSTQGIILGSDLTVNNGLEFLTATGSINTDNFTLNLASNANLSGETASNYVIGKLATKRFVGTNANNFGGIGVSVNSGTDNLGEVSVLRTTGLNGIVTTQSISGIARKWNITSPTQPVNGRLLTLSWLSADDNGKLFSSVNKAKICKLVGSNWGKVGLDVDVSGSDPRTISSEINSFSEWTVFDSTYHPTTDINDNNLNTVPKEFSLSQNYPNPFNPSTNIKYQLPISNYVTLKILDILGNEIETLVNEKKDAGTYSIVWNATKYASGIYYYKITAGNLSEIKKMILIK